MQYFYRRRKQERRTNNCASVSHGRLTVRATCTSTCLTFESRVYVSSMYVTRLQPADLTSMPLTRCVGLRSSDGVSRRA